MFTRSLGRKIGLWFVVLSLLIGQGTVLPSAVYAKGPDWSKIHPALQDAMAKNPSGKFDVIVEMKPDTGPVQGGNGNGKGKGNGNGHGNGSLREDLRQTMEALTHHSRITLHKSEVEEWLSRIVDLGIVLENGYSRGNGNGNGGLLEDLRQVMDALIVRLEEEKVA